jgi:hypothetical protein
MTTNTSLTHRLNETGFPFQEWCFSTIKNINKHDLSTKEYPFVVKSTDYNSIEGSIDILSLRFPQQTIASFKRPIALFAFECKKVNTNIKNWCFISGNREGVDPKTFFTSLCISPSSNKLELKLFDNKGVGFGINNGNSVDIADVVLFGYETNESMKDLNRNQENKIYKSLLQCVSGISAMEMKKPFTIGEVNIDEVEFSKYIGNNYLLFVPVVVTTADLWVAKFTSEKVVNGEIAESDVTWNKKDWVLYDFGLPDYLSHESAELTSRGVFIVNNNYLESFYKDFNPAIW